MSCCPSSDSTCRFARSVDESMLIACLDKSITRENLESLAFGIAEGHAELTSDRVEYFYQDGGCLILAQGTIPDPTNRCAFILDFDIIQLF